MRLRKIARVVLAISCFWPAMHAGAHAGGQIQPPRIIKHVEPVYPESARRARIQGVVVLEATVGADGKVSGARILQSITALDDAALAAVRQWEYEPATLNGVATPVIMTVRVGFSLSAEAPAGALPAANEPQPAAPDAAQAGSGWENVLQTASALALEDKTTEAIALIERFLASTPDLADAHFMLARFYEQRTGFASPPDAAQRRDLERAAEHYARAEELSGDPAMRFVTTWRLALVYGAEQLNRAAEEERYARRLVDEHPTRPESHMTYARILRSRGDIAGAAEAMRTGLAASSLPVAGLLLAVQYPIEQVQASRELSRDAARALLEQSMAAADAILAHPEKDDRDYRLATMAKALALELEAERVAENRQRRIALLLESERWGAPIEEHRNGAPPLRRLSAARTAELEWEALQRWNARLEDEGRAGEAIAAYQAYLAQRPGFGPAHAALADLFLRGARETTDAADRTGQFEQAALQLQAVLDLASSPAERDEAFSRLLQVFGPAQLNRPAQEEAAARAMATGQPASPAGHYALATVLLRTGRAAEAEQALLGARSSIRATAAARAGMASELVRIVLVQEHLSREVARRLFDEAGAVLTEAETLGAGTLEVIEGRMSWLNLQADRFESDPARATVHRERAEELRTKALELRADAIRR